MRHDRIVKHNVKEDLMKKNKHEKYSLLTAITMIVGTCIGSGIFFKSDNILIALKGVFSWVFCCLV